MTLTGFRSGYTGAGIGGWPGVAAGAASHRPNSGGNAMNAAKILAILVASIVAFFGLSFEELP